MSTDRHIQLTGDGQTRLLEELRELREEKLPSLLERIQGTTANGDVHDNPEYEGTKEDLMNTEARIRELEQTLEGAEIIPEGSPDGVVGLGSHVTVKGDDGIEETWILVEPEEASTLDGRISTASPVGEALMERKADESFTVMTPGGEISYQIVRVA
ncbi:MAG: GreA/GreB family elongation factor [Chloroflexota bacterium]|nr:GreA/GreB family elongation factor [Chloroflexota bacterium]